MIYIIILVSIAVLTLAYMRFETTLLQVNRINLSEGKPNLKIIQLSDIHIKRLKVPVKKINKAIAAEKPDMLILTGDYIEYSNEIIRFFDLIENLQINCPIYACFGNHDYKAFIHDIKGMEAYKSKFNEKGITILHNRSVCFEKNNIKYNITGIEDLKYGKWNINEALSTKCPDAHKTIAFTHNPDAALYVPDKAVDCLLAGHFHGGQVWLPFNLEFLLLRKEKLCRSGIKRGLHDINGFKLYISRGIGNVAMPIRFLSRPEITVIEI